MKNLFAKKSNNGVWIGAALMGALAAGSAAWLYFRKGTPSEQEEEAPAKDYLHPEPKLHKKKTDLHDLHAIATV